MILRGMGAMEPPAFVVDAVRQTVADPKTAAWLETKGEDTADALIKLPLLAFKPAGPPEPPNPWIDKIVSPILSPFATGLQHEATKILLPAILVGGALAMGLGYFLGRRS